MLIAGAISFSERSDHRALAKNISELSLRDKNSQVIEIISTPNVCIYTIQRPAHNPKIDRFKTSECEAFILGDISYSNQHLTEANFCLNDFHPPGRWIKIEAHNHAPKVTFTTDMLGSQWVYYARIPGGYAFANDFAALVKSLPYTPTIDTESLGAELAVTYSIGDATFFCEVNVLPSASKVSFDAEGIQISSHEPIVFSDNAALLSEKDKFQKLDEIFDSIVSNYVSLFEQSITISLSAGYDSRYALANLHRGGVRPGYCTFGNPGSSEVINAGKVADHMGASTNIFDYEAGRWAEWVSAIESLGTTGMIQWNGWAERWLQFQSQFGSATVNGYLGGPLSGKHLGTNPDPQQDWFDTWMNYGTNGGTRLTSPLITEAIRKNLIESVSDNLLHSIKGQHFALPHQTFLFYDLYGRQRRRTANQANLISRFLVPVLFFHDKSLVEFWSSLALEDLQQQRMYVSYANSRFSEIFNIYDQLKKRTLRERIGNRYDKLVRHRGSKKVAPRPSVVEHDKLIAPNKSDILALIETVKPVLSPYLDLKILETFIDNPSASPISSPQAIQGINCCILANLIAN